MRLPAEARTYRSIDGGGRQFYIIFLKPEPAREGDILLSDHSKKPDLSRFYLLEQVSRDPDRPNVIHFEDDRFPLVFGAIRVKEGSISVGAFDDMQPVPNPDGEYNLVVPERVPVAVFLCQTDDGTYVYVSSDSNRPGYAAWKLFTGDGTTMRQHADVYADGYSDGTKWVVTKGGRFDAPKHNLREFGKLCCGWTVDGAVTRLRLLEPNDYEISETPEGVTIAKK